MSAFGGKADMSFCGSPLLRSLLGVKRTCSCALHMSAFDPKRTWGPVPYWTRVHLEGEAGKLDTRWNFRMEGGDVSPSCAPSLCANQQRGGIDGHQDRVAGT